MPRSMQEKITAHLELLAESHKDVDLVRSSRASNTGSFYAQRGFDTLVEVDYDFQSDYALFALSGRLVDRIDVRAQPWARFVGVEARKAKVGKTDRLGQRHPGRQLTFYRAEYGSQSDMQAVFGLFDALLDSDDPPLS